MATSGVNVQASGSGVPVMCLHSSGASAGQWRSLAERLSPRFRVLAADLAGHGRTPGWEDTERPSLRAEAARLLPVLRGEGMPVHLVGHSYGAAVALRIAVSHPECVRSLLLFEPVPFRLLLHAADGRRALREILEVRRRLRLALAGGEPWFAAQGFYDYWSGPNAWRALPTESQRRIAARMHAVLDTFRALMADDMTPAELADVPVPALCLYGPDARRPVLEIARVLPPGFRRRHVVGPAGLGHMAPVTHPDLVNGIVEGFLEGRDGPPARSGRQGPWGALPVPA